LRGIDRSRGHRERGARFPPAAQNTEALLGITLGLMLIGLAILIRKIQKGTDNVVICRLHFRRSIWSAQS
jgi:hypothetical protein